MNNQNDEFSEQLSTTHIPDSEHHNTNDTNNNESTTNTVLNSEQQMNNDDADVPPLESSQSISPKGSSSPAAATSSPKTSSSSHQSISTSTKSSTVRQQPQSIFIKEEELSQSDQDDVYPYNNTEYDCVDNQISAILNINTHNIHNDLLDEENLPLPNCPTLDLKDMTPHPTVLQHYGPIPGGKQLYNHLCQLRGYGFTVESINQLISPKVPIESPRYWCTICHSIVPAGFHSHLSQHSNYLYKKGNDKFYSCRSCFLTFGRQRHYEEHLLSPLCRRSKTYFGPLKNLLKLLDQYLANNNNTTTTNSKSSGNHKNIAHVIKDRDENDDDEFSFDSEEMSDEDNSSEYDDEQSDSDSKYTKTKREFPSQQQTTRTTRSSATTTKTTPTRRSTRSTSTKLETMGDDDDDVYNTNSNSSRRYNSQQQNKKTTTTKRSNLHLESDYDDSDDSDTNQYTNNTRTQSSRSTTKSTYNTNNNVLNNSKNSKSTLSKDDYIAALEQEVTVLRGTIQQLLQLPTPYVQQQQPSLLSTTQSQKGSKTSTKRPTGRK